MPVVAPKPHDTAALIPASDEPRAVAAVGPRMAQDHDTAITSPAAQMQQQLHLQLPQILSADSDVLSPTEWRSAVIQVIACTVIAWVVGFIAIRLIG